MRSVRGSSKCKVPCASPAVTQVPSARAEHARSSRRGCGQLVCAGGSAPRDRREGCSSACATTSLLFCIGNLRFGPGEAFGSAARVPPGDTTTSVRRRPHDSGVRCSRPGPVETPHRERNRAGRAPRSPAGCAAGSGDGSSATSPAPEPKLVSEPVCSEPHTLPALPPAGPAEGTKVV